MSANTSLREDDFADIDARLAQTDALLAGSYPGDDGSRQPVHTLYVPADRFDRDLPARFGADALAAVEAAGGTAALAESVGLGHLADELAPLVDAKLRREPIEDLRLDFEDGYGSRGDDEEDATDQCRRPCQRDSFDRLFPEGSVEEATDRHRKAMGGS